MEKPLRTEEAKENPKYRSTHTPKSCTTLKPKSRTEPNNYAECRREAMSDMMITIDLKTFEEMSDKIIDMEDAIKQLFALLDITEETDDGRTFHPNTIRSCRAMDAQELEDLLRLMKATVEGETND